MTKIVFAATMTALISLAGTIKDPDPIQNGVETTYTTNNNENYYYFYMDGRGTIHVTTKAQRQIGSLISIESIHIYDRNMRQINNAVGEITQGLERGKYILQIKTGYGRLGTIPAGTFTAYSSSVKEKEPKITIKFKD